MEATGCGSSYHDIHSSGHESILLTHSPNSHFVDITIDRDPWSRIMLFGRVCGGNRAVSQIEHAMDFYQSERRTAE